jgi:hypothetical protein
MTIGWLVFTLVCAFGIVLCTANPLGDWLIAKVRAAKDKLVEWWVNMPGLVLLALFAAATMACSSSPIVRATQVANGAAVVIQNSDPLIEEFCIEDIKTLPDAEYKERRRICDPVVIAHDAAYVAHIGLYTALMAYDAAKDSKNIDWEQLAKLEEELRKAIVEFADAMLAFAKAKEAEKQK